MLIWPPSRSEQQMQFDLKILLRFIAIASLLIWSLTTSTILAFSVATFLIALVGATTSKQSAVISGICYSMATAGFLLIAYSLIMVSGFFGDKNFQSNFNSSIAIELAAIVSVIGVVFVLPASWVIGVVAGLLGFWFNELTNARYGNSPPN